ncbi:MAG: response regulator transcription factor, partial [Polyangiaceae bacterium]
DVSMPELNGIDATRKLSTEAPRTKVIGLSMNADRRYVLAMFAAGAVGYLLKSSASEELIQALRAVSAGQKYVSPAIANIVLEHLTQGPEARGSGLGAPSKELQIVKSLTAREREVLQLLAEGKASKEIAAQLGISLATVETHRRQIMDKLSLRTVAELTKYAIREGLTSIE